MTECHLGAGVFISGKTSPTSMRLVTKEITAHNKKQQTMTACTQGFLHKQCQKKKTRCIRESAGRKCKREKKEEGEGEKGNEDLINFPQLSCCLNI